MNQKLRFVFASSLAFLLCACQGQAEEKPNEGDQETSSKESSPYGENNVVIHFYKKAKDYSSYALWLWKKGGSGSEYSFTGSDSYGVYAVVPVSAFGVSDAKSLTMGTIVKSKGSWSYQTSDMMADLSKAPIDVGGNAEIWLKYGETEIYYSEPSKYTLLKAEFSSLSSLYLKSEDPFSSLALYSGESKVKESALSEASAEYTWSLGEDFQLDFGASYSVEATFEGDSKVKKGISFSSLYDSDAFNEAYEYDGMDLGANYSKESTLFKVWSPFSSKITLRVYSSGTPKSVSSSLGDDTHADYPMSKGEKGVWSISLPGDQEGKYYTYLVTNSSYQDQEIIDPNAKSAGIDGIRGMVVDFGKTNPEGWDEVRINEYDQKALTVYETHVSDLTSSATWKGQEKNRKRYLGLCEAGTSYSEGGKSTPTGFDYIKSLGVNAVQLQPIFDQDNDEANPSFNWGYNPLNYNVLEGSYSSDPYDGYARIKEFKEVVKAYNSAGINLIMDVVYNHVASVSGRSFDVLAPGYFFRYTSDGGLSNGSGCGNDTASERSMFANFMQQSVAFWAKEYKLGGFRFDLMGLHPIKTMNQVTKALKAINPYIAVYGEPWTLSTSTDAELADQPGIAANMDTAENFAAFNDGYRDAMIKGGLKGVGEVGFVTAVDPDTITYSSDVRLVKEGILGTTIGSSVRIDSPDRTVNYVTCHDNYTLLDRFEALDKASSKIAYTEEQKERMNVLANAMTFTSQGISFMQEGEEFLRSKGGESNSYGGQNDGRDYAKMNELDYSLAIKHAGMVENYKALIKAKQGISGLHLNAEEAAKLAVNADSTKKNELYYDVPDGKGGTYRIAHANGTSVNPEAIDFSGFDLVLDTLSSGVALSEATPMSPYQTIIAHKA